MTSEGGKQGKPSFKVLKGELEQRDVAAEGAGETPNPGGPPQDRRISRDDLVANLSRRASGEIFPQSPVKALGINGDTCFYLSVLGQLEAINNHTKEAIERVFAPRSDYLDDWFPQFSKSGKSGFSQDLARRYMMQAAAEKGIWNAFERVRGLGAWPDDDGGVILHCGNAVLHKGVWRSPGELDGFVYPSQPKIPRPLDLTTEPADFEPAREALELISSWNWYRGEVDAYLLLGWAVAAMFGGAMDWRPLIWVTGDAGTGKSTLHKLIRHLMGGEGAILQSTDATEASVRQFLMQSTVPVALDEVEAEADSRKVLSVVKLARQAASGGVVLRGGADHKGQEFKARSSFMFSSILVPALLEQDISRIALLELMQLPRGNTPPEIEPRHWTRIGRGIRARAIAQWGRLHQTLELYRAALARAGHNARGCDQFGTLLTMADLAFGYGAPDEGRCEAWAEKLAAAAIDEQTDRVANWQQCLNHLFGQQLDVYRGGERHTVGRLILSAAGIEDAEEITKANRALSTIGLRVYGRKQGAQVAIANAHVGLALLFRDTRWADGVWSQAMKRVPGSTASSSSLRFDMVSSRARMLPLRAIPGVVDAESNGPAKDVAGPPDTPDTSEF